jgi:hypothetical protein
VKSSFKNTWTIPSTASQILKAFMWDIHNESKSSAMEWSQALYFFVC